CFCRGCGSPLWSRRESEPEIVRIRLGLLDADPGRRPLAHAWVGEKAPWYEITDDLPRSQRGAEGSTLGSNRSRDQARLSVKRACARRSHRGVRCKDQNVVSGTAASPCGSDRCGLHIVRGCRSRFSTSELSRGRLWKSC